MRKEELIKELEKLRDVENYSNHELMNTGYKTGILDALDLVIKYFDLALVVDPSEHLQAFFDFYKQKLGGGFNTDVLEIILKQYQKTLQSPKTSASTKVKL